MIHQELVLKVNRHGKTGTRERITANNRTEHPINLPSFQLLSSQVGANEWKKMTPNLNKKVHEQTKNV